MEGGSPERVFFEPVVGWKPHIREIILLVVAGLTPVITLFVWFTGDALQRAGGVMVFFAVSAEFITLNKANNKHLYNASRVYNDDPPWLFSKSDRIIGRVAIAMALVGTLLWVFGDFLLL
jgi:hypothetical protein